MVLLKNEVIKEMELDEKTNYVVSGLERSGTSMLMQILKAGNVPIKFDESRAADENNPKGYFELEGGKIINRLMEGNFQFEKYKGEFIKITAYGLKFLPPGKYTIIYSERDIEEILDSMEKMAKIEDENRDDTKKAFLNLNEMIKNQIIEREDVDVLFINYNNVLSDPEINIRKIKDFLKINDNDYHNMIKAVDEKLYRQRRIK